MNRRRQRVEVAIQRIISRVLQKGDLPGDSWKVNITRVSLTENLRHARLYFTSLDGEPGREAATAFLQENRAALRRALARELRVKYQPEIHFAWDTVLLEAEKVEELLDDLKRGRPDDRPGEDNPGVTSDEEEKPEN